MWPNEGGGGRGRGGGAVQDKKKRLIFSQHLILLRTDVHD